MNLVILTQYYPPEIGAPQARLSELAAQFVERGHKVTVLTAMPNYPEGRIHEGYGGLMRRESQDGVDVIRTFIYPTQKADFVRRLTNYFSFAFSSALIGSFRLPRADYLLVESPPLFLGISAFWLSRLKKSRMIFNVSDLWPESAARLGVLDPQSLAYRLSERLEAFFYRHAWLTTGQSKTILSSIVGRFPSCPVFHLSNGVDSQKFSPELRPDSASTEFRTNGEMIAMYAGLHGLAQGLDQILAAADILRNDGVRFVLVGDGPEKKLLVEQAQRQVLANVRFLDPRTAPEMPSLLAASDVALVTLKTYIPGAVPSKLYEAMATGRALVLVAKGEAADIVTENQAGITVEPGDIDGLAEALRRLRAEPELRRKLGQNGRRAAEEIFDRRKVIARFVDHLEADLTARTA